MPASQGSEEVEDEGQGEDDHHDEMSFVDKQQPAENGTLVYHDPGQSLERDQLQWCPLDQLQA